MAAPVDLMVNNADVSMRVSEQRQEIEEMALLRLRALYESAELGRTIDRSSLRASVSLAVAFDLTSLGYRYKKRLPVPPELLLQARMAARLNISLAIVFRSYLAGYIVANDYLVQEIGRAEGGSTPSRALIRGQACLLDRVMAAVADEYTREVSAGCATTEDRRLAAVKGLLSGESLDTSDLAYDFDAYHLGLVAVGPEAAGLARQLATALDRRILVVNATTSTTWAWLGGRRPVDSHAVRELLSAGWPQPASVSFGEWGSGLNGWRISHEQARAALPVVLRTAERYTRYGEVALLSAALQDHLLATSLQELYLTPFSQERDGGKTVRATLRAYFAADRNLSSAAAALRVSRQTVTKRLRNIEARLERPFSSCAIEIEAALRLHELENPRGEPSGPSPPLR